LTDSQCSAVRDALALGCDRATACHFSGVTLEELQTTIDADETLERKLAQAEARASVRHIGYLHEAAKDERNWRISVWWLEQRDKRQSREASTEPGERHLRELVQALAKVVVEVIPDVALQQKLIERLLAVLTGGADAAAEPAVRPAPVLLLT